METGNITLIGLIGIILITSIREFIAWLGKKNLLNTEQRLGNIEKAIFAMTKQISDLHEWHDKSDQDGVKVWYVRQSLETALRDNAQAVMAIAKNSELQTRLLEEMLESQKNLMREQLEIIKTIRDLERNVLDKD